MMAGLHGVIRTYPQEVINMDIVQKDLDQEWIALIQEAIEIEIPLDEIYKFLKNNDK